MEDLKSIISKEQLRYFNFFKEASTSLFKSKQNDNPATELLIQTEGSSSPYNLIRADFISKDKNNQYNILEIQLDDFLNYSTQNYLISNTAITIKPFWWSKCQFSVDKIQLQIISNWVTENLKIDDELNESNFIGAIHSSTFPTLNNNFYKFEIDFGTAPDSLLIDFIELLSQCGANVVTIETEIGSVK
ncbi:hypothetical protein Emtol_3411 [Emticicia oligotrophica DSM 17448]|uniref:Uncharacterized protein n=1 Tax=Emticicia oligotrophica (strain DSM 17448 / CIP 109782 / MTCC 6937 / GPTSA100-15) TaxID=929562 RepID=A0ABM5N544_EMTOG|nr:hypothetical protein [Emticicia oligotrophica]AFK04540.1 hypothetical protein Emtol_3411 [Emticicia oligotrophica DSM 17448]